MPPDRREFLRLAAPGVAVAAAGCPSGPTDGADGPETGIEAVDTLALEARSERPAPDEEGVGRAILVDGEERERAALARYGAVGGHGALGEFRSGIGYDRERLLLVESSGPNACHDRLELGSIRAEGGRIRADAAVVDSREATDGGDRTACAEVVTHPATLARITFADGPLDSATVETTDGWGRTADVRADVEDPLAPDPDSLAGAIRPDGDPDPIEPLECERAGVERYDGWFEPSDVVWGNLEADGDGGDGVALALRIDDTAYGRGETASIRLRNVADRIVNTGNRRKYSLEVYTESGWQDVRVGDADGVFEYTDEAVGHVPGEGFEWSIELTESGVAGAAPHDHAAVCPALAAGRYRFVYWGAIGGAVAVGFDLT
jgi:hypothetical protein